MTIYTAADNIISPLGFTTAENFGALEQMRSGVKRWEKSPLSPEPVMAGLIDQERMEKEFHKLSSGGTYTRFEKLAILSVSDALKQNSSIDIRSPKTLLILSSTKGNIDLLGEEDGGKFGAGRLKLWETARVIASHFKNPNQPLVVSNACISGVVAIILGKRLLESGPYENMVICGADLLSHFIVSGFQSFKAVSSEICKPYDVSRDGISLGEAAGTIILTNNEKLLLPGTMPISVKGGASSNDANHISGPSRDGEGLCIAIRKTLRESEVRPADVDHISGHGTATVFNDDMESLAITDAQLNSVPMNSLKSYFGHTLGAAGIIESVIALESIRRSTMIGTFNHHVQGVTKPINILTRTTAGDIRNCLKTAAGFGGCNAAVFFSAS